MRMVVKEVVLVASSVLVLLVLRCGSLGVWLDSRRPAPSACQFICSHGDEETRKDRRCVLTRCSASFSTCQSERGALRGKGAGNTVRVCHSVCRAVRVRP
ncbi:hypothetical protein E2C01_072004 [Portunus trituberculatus]|uniref:Uncharacterized protein n=1 Tax=Portunus trituberculatus TaxID=210409 RepID=A0A5B7I7S9_PORTR|nr:hypothetical protein [Portunus trituberculatus]